MIEWEQDLRSKMEKEIQEGVTTEFNILSDVIEEERK